MKPQRPHAAGTGRPTGLVTAPIFLRHDTGPGHPERPARLSAILERLGASGLAAELAVGEAQAAERDWTHLVHDTDYVDALERAIAGGARQLGDGDTTVSADSFQAALTAVGAGLAAAERVARGTWRNAFVALRPPGHHAERGRAMGFCLLNNVAVAARFLQARCGVQRPAIVDWDVHHGNGTQHAFEEDASVFFASLHQFPHYPGTGSREERGRGAGEGTTLNLPMPSGAGDAEYLAAFEGTLLPALEDFAPDFVLISAGFDAHRDDPLSGTRVTGAGFGRMTRLLVDFAETRCQGRVISLLEGGYDLSALAESVEAHVAELLRRP